MPGLPISTFEMSKSLIKNNSSTYEKKKRETPRNMAMTHFLLIHLIDSFSQQLVSNP
ncbi:hypothetical protein HanXRQr2_Chr08g0325731 [Helianthus annuus]|uniref:Uncharacterized protein n=1 Tax=Helianthus annuus TaxID=4232 RepID=A0A9K3NBZ9_HELAN|nr:hypothetical protein HanXRQr2_Chr08g0325731 [Helianthus annuus]